MTDPGNSRPDDETDSARKVRYAEFDVVRAFVLIGVFTMNYIVFLNITTLRELSRQGMGWNDLDAPRWLVHLMNTETGPLSTRFAACLATLVGMGVTFLAGEATRTRATEIVRAAKWRLRRRGVLFILIGIFFDAMWPGTILWFTGTYLVLCSFMIMWRTRSLVLAAVVVILATVAQRVTVYKFTDQHPDPISWWSGYSQRGGGFGRMSVGTPQGFLTAILGWGGHPILPWMTFVIVGMILARLDWRTSRTFLRVGLCGLLLAAAGYALAFIGERTISGRWKWVASIDPGAFRRERPFGLGMPAFVIAAIGSSLAAIAGIGYLARRFPRALPTRILARAGRMTFTLYILHGAIPWLLFSFWIDQKEAGLVTSMVIAAAAWFVAVVLGAAFQKHFRIGPLERLLRNFGG